MWTSPEADGDDEYTEFVRIVRSAGDDVDELNAQLAIAQLPRLRSRMARLDEYAVRPLRVADPVRHLDNALEFVLAAMGRPDLANGLRRSPRMVAYRLIVGYMRAFLLHSNEYCYRSAERELLAAVQSPPSTSKPPSSTSQQQSPSTSKPPSPSTSPPSTSQQPSPSASQQPSPSASPPSTSQAQPPPPPPAMVVTLRESTFKRHMYAGGGPCAHLFTNDRVRWLGRLDRVRVSSAVRHVFADWDTTARDHGRACRGSRTRPPGLDMFLTYDQYERLSRHGVVVVATGGRRLTRASVPDDPAHAHCALLRSFLRVQYSTGYQDRLMRSLRRSFGPPFLEAVAAAYADAGGGGGDGGVRRAGEQMQPDVVIEAARRMNIPWFAEGTETPEQADLYYAHRGFHPDL